MLREIGERLRRNLRAGDLDMVSDSGGLIARLGGDEFVLVARVDGVRGAQSLARRLLDALAPPFELAGRSVMAAASIGIVIADQHCEGVDALMRDADQAMFEAKRAGGACSAVFDGPMRRRGERRQAMRLALRDALDAPGQLSLAYQPVVDLDSGSRCCSTTSSGPSPWPRAGRGRQPAPRGGSRSTGGTRGGRRPPPRPLSSAIGLNSSRRA